MNSQGIHIESSDWCCDVCLCRLILHPGVDVHVIKVDGAASERKINRAKRVKRGPFQSTQNFKKSVRIGVAVHSQDFTSQFTVAITITDLDKRVVITEEAALFEKRGYIRIVENSITCFPVVVSIVDTVSLEVHAFHEGQC